MTDRLARMRELYSKAERIRLVKYKKEGKKIVGSTLMATQKPKTIITLINLLIEAESCLSELNDILSDPYAREEMDSFTAQPTQRLLSKLSEFQNEGK